MVKELLFKPLTVYVIKLIKGFKLLIRLIYFISPN